MNKTTVLWNIYFWISVIVAVLNIISLVEQILVGQVSGVLIVAATVIYALAVYSYVFKKHIFSQRNWKSWLVIVLLAQALRWFPTLLSQNIIWDPMNSAIIILGILIFPFPAWYCIYKLGFDKKERVKVAAAKTSKKKTAKKLEPNSLEKKNK